MLILKWEDILSSFNNGIKLFQDSIITIGSFDGLHVGHRLLCDKVLSLKRGKISPTKSHRCRTKAGLITFTRPTRSKKETDYAGDIITTRLKLNIIEDLGFDFVVLIDFTENFAKTSGYDFFSLLHNALFFSTLCIGEDFVCGHNHSTGINEIHEIAKTFNFSVEVVNLAVVANKVVSSSYLRKAILRGKFALCKKLLSIPYALDLEGLSFSFSDNTFHFDKKLFYQVLPLTKQYPVLVETNSAKTFRALFFANNFEVTLTVDNSSYCCHLDYASLKLTKVNFL